MKVDAQWLLILKRAWSIRFIILAGLLTAAEVLLPIFQQDLPRHVFAILSLFAIAGAFISRVVIQKDL
jgi:hypothetical protein